MGYNSYNHFGAYIEMPEIKKEVTKTIRRCSNKSCSNHKIENMSKDSQFCHKCGEQVEQFDKKNTVNVQLNYYDFAEKNGLDPEIFAQVQDQYILIPNRHFGKVTSWDQNEQFSVEFDWGDSRKAMVEFTNEAQKFIDKVKEIYAIELQVKFGIVSYTM